MQTLSDRSGPQRRAFWLRTLHQWHWISSALCLIGLLAFASTGITLNHASQIPASPRTTTHQGQLPESLRLELAAQAAQSSVQGSSELGRITLDLTP